MTREEAVIILDGFKNNPLFSDTHAQAFDVAISALSAIEKIRAEIENDAREYRCDEFVDGINHALEIIDKYIGGKAK